MICRVRLLGAKGLARLGQPTIALPAIGSMALSVGTGGAVPLWETLAPLSGQPVVVMAPWGVLGAAGPQPMLWPGSGGQFCRKGWPPRLLATKQVTSGLGKLSTSWIGCCLPSAGRGPAIGRRAPGRTLSPPGFAGLGEEVGELSLLRLRRWTMGARVALDGRRGWILSY